MFRSVTAIASVLFLSFAGPLAFGQVDEPPVGSVVAWMKSFENVPGLPDGWVECNGQVLDDPASPFDGQTIPDLNGEKKVLQGKETSGGNGNGLDSGNGSGIGLFTNHPGGTKYLTPPDQCNNDGIIHYYLDWCENYVYTGRVGNFGSSTTYAVVWIMKVKSSPGTVPAVSEWGLIAMALLILAAATIVFMRRRPLTMA